MNETKTKVNESTNNFIIRMWSKHHYGENVNKQTNIYQGSIQNVQTKNQIFFDSPADMMEKIEYMYKQAEIVRKSKCRTR